VFTPPRGAALPIFTDNDAKPDASAPITIIATLTQLQHALTQFVASYPASPGWRWSNRDGGSGLRSAILRRNNDPRSIATLLIATLLIIAIAPGPRFAQSIA
jgi:hypothetical protein